MQWVTAAIGLGSNLSNPILQIKTALKQLAQLPHSRLIGQSSLYRSQPVGEIDQPRFINAVALLSTRLTASKLLQLCFEIEQAHRRVRNSHRQWGPRTLDLDILLYGTRRIHCTSLIVPHRELHRRCFVLKPLAEINPQLLIPGRGRVEDWLDVCKQSGQQVELLENQVA